MLDKLFGDLRSKLNDPSSSRNYTWSLIHEAHELDPDAYFDTWWPYLEGFRDYFSEPAAYREHIDDVADDLEILPFVTLELRPPLEELGHLVTSPLLAHVSKLDLNGLGLTADQLQALLDADALDALRHLDVRHNKLKVTGVKAIARCARLANLSSLDVSRNAIGSSGLRHLCKSDNLKNLRRLSTQQNRLDDKAIAALVSAPFTQRLEHLDLGKNKITDARPLLDAIDGGPMRHLQLDRNALTDDSALALAEHTNLPHLTELTLDDNGIGDDAFRALALSKNLSLSSRLSALLIHSESRGRTLIDDHRAELEALDRAPEDAKPFTLRLACQSTDRSEERCTDALVALSEEPIMRKAEATALRLFNVTREASAALAASPYLTSLRALGITMTGTSDISALVASPNISGITDLDLDYNGYVTDEGIQTLIDSEHLSSLKRLDIKSNLLTAAGVAAFASSNLFRRLEHLAFSPRDRNTFPPEAYTQLLASPNMEGLETLDLNAEAIDDEMLLALAESPHVGALRKVDYMPYRSRFSQASLDAFMASPGVHMGLKLEMELESYGTTRPSIRAQITRWLQERRRRNEPITLDYRLRGSGADLIDAILEVQEPLDLRAFSVTDLDGHVTTEQLRALLASPHVSTLETFGYRMYQADSPKTLEVVVDAAPRLPALRALIAHGRGASDEGARALASSPLLARLTRLELRGKALTDEGREALDASPHMTDALREHTKTA